MEILDRLFGTPEKRAKKAEEKVALAKWARENCTCRHARDIEELTHDCPVHGDVR